MTFASRIALPLIASLAVLSLSACKGEGDQTEAAASAAPEAKPDIKINGARVVLPGVPGNPGAAYFSLDNQSKDNVSIAAVAVAGVGRTEMHVTEGDAMKKVDRADASARTHLDFAPGKLHVMLFDFSGDMSAGDEVELTVTFADGDKLSVQAKVQAAGEAAMGGMSEGHDH
ncbi:MAG: copper chaperone PCu(A)C [Novosphingobium sp.]|uniref:copper chaperone PCu(A)C n=1 Tax=Novosphingobium sp. TaxID=1874826 RepID=UPI0032B9864C